MLSYCKSFKIIKKTVFICLYNFYRRTRNYDDNSFKSVIYTVFDSSKVMKNTVLCY